MALIVARAEASQGGGGGETGVPDFDEYVSPYDDLVQLYVSPTGAGNNSGSSAGNAMPIASAKTRTTEECRNLLAGTYNMFTLWGALQDMNAPGSGPHITDRIIWRPNPGDSVTLNLQENAIIVAGCAFHTWDGEGSGFVMTNGGTLISSTNSYGEESQGLVHKNMTITQTWDGDDNTAICYWNAESFDAALYEIDNVRVNSTTSAPDANLGSFILDYGVDWIIRNSEGVGNPSRSLYLKHAHSGKSEQAHNCLLERSIFTGSNNGLEDQQNFLYARDCVIDKHYNDEGGTTGGNFQKYVHCTWPVYHAFQNVQAGGDAQPGQYGGYYRFCVVDTLDWANATVPDMDWNLFEQNIGYNGSSYNLAGIRTLLGGDANSIQQALSFVGSDADVPTDWALASGGGINGSPTGLRDLGANTAKVGKRANGTTKPNVYEEFYKSPLNQRSDSEFYGSSVAVTIGTHPRHGFGALTINSTLPDIRHAFTASDEVTVECEFWRGASVSQDIQILHLKGSSAAADESKASGMIVSLIADQASAGANNPANLKVFVRDEDAGTTTYANADGGNLATDDDVNVYDGSIHRVRMFCKANTAGNSDGVLELWVDHVLTIARADVKYFGEQFDQLLLPTAMSASETAGLAYLRLFNRDW